MFRGVSPKDWRGPLGDRIKIKMFADGAPEARGGGVYDARFTLARR